MVAYKAAQTARFVTKPDRRFPAMLLYGPDAGFVADRADVLAGALAAGGDPEIVRLGERDLSEDPDRLAIELRTLPMFASGKVVRLRAGGRLDVKALESLLAGPLDAVLVVEAGSLKPTSPLRKAFEKADGAVALPCYVEGSRDTRAVIDAELEGTGLALSAEARAHLMNRLGGDPVLARSELVKLVTYAQGASEIRVGDVDAIVGDGSQAALEALTNAAGAHDLSGALQQLDRLVAAGQSVQGALTALGAHFRRLHRVAALAETGQPLKNVLARLKPPLHYKQRDALAAQTRLWSSRNAAEALRQVQRTTRSARLTPELERQLTEQLLVALAARRPGPSRKREAGSRHSGGDGY